MSLLKATMGAPQGQAWLAEWLFGELAQHPGDREGATLARQCGPHKTTPDGVDATGDRLTAYETGGRALPRLACSTGGKHV